MGKKLDNIPFKKPANISQTCCIQRLLLQNCTFSHYNNSPLPICLLTNKQLQTCIPLTSSFCIPYEMWIHDIVVLIVCLILVSGLSFSCCDFGIPKTCGSLLVLVTIDYSLHGDSARVHTLSWWLHILHTHMVG